jgi:hypothetical protein
VANPSATGDRVADAAARWLDGLEPDQRSRARFAFDSAARVVRDCRRSGDRLVSSERARDSSPRRHRGIGAGALDPTQRPHLDAARVEAG